jgi:serine/threonine-protein kinase
MARTVDDGTSMRNGALERRRTKAEGGTSFVIGRGDRRYEITKLVSQGGMGTVHLGRMLGPLGFEKRVAIKSLRRDKAQSPAVREMFINEARLTARLDHANIASTVDVLIEANAMYIVMEYIDGCCVADLCTQAHSIRRPIPISVACAIAHDALLGLDYAHDACDEQLGALRVVHCDVSPQNVRVGKDGLSRILDFGIARAADGIHTTTSKNTKLLHGKIAYMAPEQLQGETLDRRADVYGMGVLLWEMLAGRSLFAADSAAGVVSQVLRGKIDPPSRYARSVPPDLDDIVMKALCRERNGRWESAGAMAARLAPFAATRREVAETLRELSPSEYTPVSGIRSVARVARTATTVSARVMQDLPLAPTSWSRARAPMAALALITLGLLGLAIGASRRVSHVPTPVITLKAQPPAAAPAVLPSASVALTATAIARADPPPPATRATPGRKRGGRR